MATAGYIDKMGFYPAGGGWLLCGWIPVAPALARGLPLSSAVADIAARAGSTGLSAQLGLYDRPELGTTGTGLVLFVRGDAALGDGLKHIRLRFGRNGFQADAGPATAKVPEAEMVRFCRALVGSCFDGQLDELALTLRNEGFRGVDTLDTLPELVRGGVDELIVCRPDGVVLMGWVVAAPGTVRSMTLCTAEQSVPVDPAASVQTDRLDVVDSVGRPLGLEDSQCGFVAFVPATLRAHEPAWLRVETADGRTGYVTIPPRRLRGLPAIRRMLTMLDVADADIRPAFDAVIGPACARLNADRLSVPPKLAVARFGPAVEAPRFSLVIPLFGRIDYLEYQIAAMSFADGVDAWQIIYVLDDPPRRRELLQLAESVHARFGVPFEVLMLDQNLGYAPANNRGLAAARGEFVCYLNSDVLPRTPDFLHRLAADLMAHPDIGVVGGLLLFEDGSVQHEGMTMRPVPGKGGLCFPLHTRKGWRPRPDAGLERCEMITGACMMMRRSLAEQLGGFDEGFIIGDFEDADLCTRLRATGAVAAVDHTVQFYHLERQSQAGLDGRWRDKLTLYNAWLYDGRRRDHAGAASH